MNAPPRTRIPLSSRLTRRGLLGWAAAGSAAAALSGCASGSQPKPTAKIEPKIDGDLNFFNWSDYIDPEIVSSFEKEYDVKVSFTYFSGQDELVAKIASGAPYDLAVAGSHSVPKLVKSDLLRPFDHSELSNWGEVTEFFTDPPYDPGAKYTVPYDVGSNGITWRTDKIQGEMTGSWNDLWDHPEAADRIWVFDAMQMALGMSLLRLGHSVNSSDAAQVKAAADELIKLKPRMGGFSSDDLTLMENGQGWLLQAYSGSTYQALNAVDDPSALEYQACKEGGLFNADNMVIPAAAKAPGTALAFIDWVLKPENAAANVKFHGYPMPTQAGLESFKDMVKDFPFLAGDLELMDKPELWLESLEGERLDLWNNEWSRVRAS